MILNDRNRSNKMLCWYYEKNDLKNTPSLRDGLDFETEQRYRKEGVRFIMECGTKMSLGHNTIATGAVYFHRFYMFHTFKEFPRYVTACCCLFLAGKVEETPKKCRDIITTARDMLPDTKFQTFSDDLRKAKEEVMTLESILLQTIKFDLQVEHPYGFLVKYAKCLKGDQVKLQKMVQMAWNFVNDSLSTTVCLQWEPEIIAVALIFLACKLSKFTVSDWTGRQPTHLRWWDMFITDVAIELLEDICHQVLDLYQNQPGAKRGSKSPPDQQTKKVAVAVVKTATPLPKQKTASPNVGIVAAPPQAQMPVATRTLAMDTKPDIQSIPRVIPAPPLPPPVDNPPFYHQPSAPGSGYGPIYNSYHGPPPPMQTPLPPMPPHMPPPQPPHMYPVHPYHSQPMMQPNSMPHHPPPPSYYHHHHPPARAFYPPS